MASSTRPSSYGSHRCCSLKTSYWSRSSSFIYSLFLAASGSKNDAVHHSRYRLTGNILNDSSGSRPKPKSDSISVGERGFPFTSQGYNRQLQRAHSPPLWHLTLAVCKRSQWSSTVHSRYKKSIISLHPSEMERDREKLNRIMGWHYCRCAIS